MRSELEIGRGLIVWRAEAMELIRSLVDAIFLCRRFGSEPTSLVPSGRPPQ